MENKSFSQQLKDLRAKNGMSQQALADAVGIHRVQIARLEAGVYQPSWDTVQKLAKALGVDCRAFADEPDEPPPAKKPRKKK